MIYLISNQKSVWEDIKNISIEESLELLNRLDIISVDTETTGFSPHSDKILSLQIGNYDIQVVIDATTINITVYKELLESKLCIFQNAKFDLKFLYKKGIIPTKIFDTYLAEVKLHQGLLGIRKNLQVLTEKYCQTNDVDKAKRGWIHKYGLYHHEVLKYAAYDVKYLERIKEAQERLLLDKNLTKAVQLENEFVVVLAYIEYCGIYIDKNQWINKVNRAKNDLDILHKDLNKFIIDNNLTKYINSQLNLFSTEKEVLINWNSPKQVITLFKELGVNTKNDKGKDSIDSKILSSQISKSPIVKKYLDFKKEQKDVSTYGMNFLSHINKYTNRIHSNFTQILDTGRTSCGGKNKTTGESYINLQNLPNNKETRDCFIAEKNNILVNCDYSGMEYIVMVNKSEERNLIEFFKSGEADLHSFVASKIYPELKDSSLSDIKKYHKDKRQNAKSGGFCFLFGGTGFTAALNLNIPIKQGEELEEMYFNAFSGLKNYFDKSEKLAIKRGYILIDNITGSKQFIGGFDKFKALHNKFEFKDKNRAYWDKYKVEKANNSNWYRKEKEEVSYYFRWRGQIRRNSINAPVQGTAASIAKKAGILFFNWIIENNYFNIVKISNFIHDEYLVECPIEISKIVANKLQYCMEKASEEYCTIIPMKAEPQIVKKWEH